MNIRILIADDEKLARLVLKSLLFEINPSFVIEEAINGNDLKEKAQSFVPHIAFVDIQMPLTSGLDAIKALKKALPFTQWFILTGFANFDYAKDAIALQVTEYLVKPIRKKQLEQCIKHSQCRLSQTIDNINATFEQKMRMSVKSNHNAKDLLFYQIAMLAIDHENPQKQATIIKHIIDTAKIHIHEIFEIIVQGAIFQLDENHILFTACASSKNIIEKLCMEVIEKTIGLSTKKLWVLSSRIMQGSEQLPKTIQILQKKIGMRLMLQPFKIQYVDMLESMPNIHLLETISQTMIKAINHKNQGDALLFKRESDRAIEEVLKLEPYNKRELSCFLSYLFDFYDLISPINMFEHSFQSCHDMVLNQFYNRSDTNSYQITQVIKYIDTHFSQDIGVKEIASLAGISPNYLSAKFKQETGKRFVDYLTNLRIDHAKLLLANTMIYVHVVAKEVGYKDPKHFSHVFEELVGCSPSNYRESMKTKNSHS